MNEEAQLLFVLFGGLGILVAIAGLCGFLLGGGDSSARRWWIAFLSSALAVVTWFVFLYDMQINLVGDYGTDFPHRAASGDFLPVLAPSSRCRRLAGRPFR